MRNVVAQASAEAKGVAQAKRNKKRRPATPACDAMERAYELGLDEEASGRIPRARKWSDDELVEIVREVVEGGHARTAGGATKWLREQDRGISWFTIKPASTGRQLGDRDRCGGTGQYHHFGQSPVILSA